MSNTDNIIVITGPAHAGKTTVINELRKRGHLILPESAIQLIDLGLSLSKDVRSWQDWRNIPENESQLQKSIYLSQIAKEQLARHRDEHVFSDRGTLDGIAYCRLRGVQYSTWFKNIPRYKLAFLLAPLKFNARSGSGRIDTEDDNRLIHQLIKEVYLEYKIRVIDVPLMNHEHNISVKLRADFIEQNTQAI